MPRQLTKRGHRLVFSNGIIFLAVARSSLLIVTDAKVDRLIPLYAIGVFTSFTLSQAGMAKHHLDSQGARLALRACSSTAIGAVLSFLVLVIVAITKFTHGAWVIIVLVPVMVVAARPAEPPVRGRGRRARGRRAAGGRRAPILRRHVVIVFVDDARRSPPPGRSSTPAR